MIAPSNDRCFVSSVGGHIVKDQTRSMAFAKLDSTDPRRHAVKWDFVLGHVEPVGHICIVYESFFRLLFA